MEYSFKEFSIRAPFVTTACGHLCQTFDIYECKDQLNGRVFAFRNEKDWLIHVSLDVLAFSLDMRNEVQNAIRAFYRRDEIHLISSTTHTHYSHSVNDMRYVAFLVDLIIQQIKAMEYKQIGEVTTSYIVENKMTIGKSRITGYESNNEYLGLLRFYHQDENFLTLIINNCHPTTLAGTTTFFSSEYPGYVLRKLKQAHPQIDYTFIQGACGDISTRFMRSGQDYTAMEEMGEVLYQEIEQFNKTNSDRVPLSLSYREEDMYYDHEFTSIDLSNIRTNLSKRELESIEGGQIMRARAEKSGKIIKHQLIASWSTGTVKIIFFPNEIFSCYMDLVDKQTTYLASYSNGYGPYITPIDFPYLTYEIFMDTTTKETKKMIMEKIKSI